MDEYHAKLVLIALMLIMFFSSAVILAYKGGLGSSLSSEGIVLGCINFRSAVTETPFNLRMPISNPLNHTLNIHLKVVSTPSYLAEYANATIQTPIWISGNMNTELFFTIVLRGNPYNLTGTYTIYALGTQQ